METSEIRIVFFRLQNHLLFIFEQLYGNPTYVVPTVLTDCYNLTEKNTFFWFGALMMYIPLSLMDVANDKDESSTDPWLSLTVFNHSK